MNILIQHNRVRLASVCCGLTLLGGLSVVAQQPAHPADSQRILVPLEYREVKFDVDRVWVEFAGPKSRQAKLVKKAPAGADGKLVYSALQFGPETVALVCDKSRGKLYVDLNRNGDLTDDADGVYESHETGPVQRFSAVRLAIGTNGVQWNYLVDLTLYGFLTASGNGFITVRSFYDGQAVLSGKQWQIGLIKVPGIYPSEAERTSLLFRSWDERTNSFGILDAKANILSLCEKVFLQDKTYEPKIGFTGEGDSVKPRLELLPVEIPLGDLRIAGRYVHQLVLEGPPACAVIIEEPPALVRLPVGDYESVQVYLKHGDSEASAQFDLEIAVTNRTVGTLPVGGPLTNSVRITRTGRTLRMDYEIVGWGSKPYELVSPDTRKEPKFAVYKGNQRIATGKFRFG